MKLSLVILLSFQCAAFSVFAQGADSQQTAVDSAINKGCIFHCENTGPEIEAEVRNQLLKKDEEIARLRDILDRNTSKIKFATLIQSNFLERTAVFHFKTDSYGKVIVNVKANDGYNKSEESTDKEHIVRFDGLSPQTTYELKIYAVNPSDTRKEIPSDFERFTTMRAGTDYRPVVIVQDAAKIISSNAVTIEFDSEKSVQIEIYCKKKVGNSLEAANCSRKTYGEIGLNKVGLFKNEVKTYKGRSEMEISELDPDTEYEFSGKAVSESGIESDMIFRSSYKTKTAAGLLDFDGPVKFEIRPDITLVSWKWMTKPRESRVGIMISGANVQFSEFNVNEQEKTTTASIPLEKLMGALSGDKKEPPEITVIMEADGQKPVKRQFSFAFVIPKVEPRMSKKQQDAIRSATEVFVEKRGKLNWENLRQIGLPILFSFLSL